MSGTGTRAARRLGTDVSRRRTGKDFSSADGFFPVWLEYNGRMVERNGGKVESDGFEH
jgi:hypothetical protein